MAARGPDGAPPLQLPTPQQPGPPAPACGDGAAAEAVCAEMRRIAAGAG
eukprot:gene45117-23324_t